MTVFLLIRHGSNDLIAKGILAGRNPGVHLDERGRRQAGMLARNLSDLPIAAVYSSPLERTRETAEPLAKSLRQTVHLLPEVIEVDFGRWTGKSFDELRGDPLWREFNEARGSMRIPDGESIQEVQQRMLAALDRLRELHQDGILAVFSHGDPIRTVVAHALGIPLDYIVRMRVSTASISAISYAGGWPQVVCVNCLTEFNRFGA